MEKTVYIRLRHRIQANLADEIKIKDIAQIVAKPSLKQQIENLVVYKITKEDKTVAVIDGMKVFDKLKSVISDVDIQTIGPAQTIIEIGYTKRKMSKIYFVAIWLLLFIGSALAIMNFHEDVSMQEVHQKIYKMITGETNPTPLLLQIPYSIGLGVGMILFFNHLFRKRLNEEPSPLEVEMFNYQQDLDRYLVIHERDTKKVDDH